MDVRIDSAYGWMVRREMESPLVASAPSVPSPDPKSSAPQITAASVAPTGQAASADAKSSRKDRPEDQGERSSRATPMSGGRYQQKLVYDAEIKRLFLDVIDKENEELLVRMPPEELARYLEEASALPTAKPKTESDRPRLDTRA